MKYLTVVFCLIITFLIVIEPLYAEIPKCRWNTACLTPTPIVISEPYQCALEVTPVNYQSYSLCLCTMDGGDVDAKLQAVVYRPVDCSTPVPLVIKFLPYPSYEDER